MTDDAINGNTQTALPKLSISQCVCKSGQLIVKPITAGLELPKKIIHPLNLSGDSRLFAKNGEVVRPFVTVEFNYLQTIDVSGIAIAVYEEAATHEFDPSDMQPIAVRSLDKEFDELNATVG
jgi:hypothetical protein